MNLVPTRSLKGLALYLLAALLLVFAIEFVVVRYKIENLEEIELKKDFARTAQLYGQQIAYLVQTEHNLEKSQSPEIIAMVNEHEHKLQVLGSGGRINNTEIFLEPLSRLPRITFDQLVIHWNDYKSQLKTLSDGENFNQPITTPVPDTTAVSADSTVVVNQVASKKPESIEEKIALLSGQWLTISTWYDRLLKDLSDEADEKKSSVERWFLAFVIIDILLLAVVFYAFYRFVLVPIRLLNKDVIALRQHESGNKNEIGELNNSINEIIEQLNDATEFVAAIGEGKLDFDYRSLDQDYVNGKNRLADSLISMQEKLKQLNIEEQRRQWANEGLTKFVDILRSSDDNIHSLGDKIISSLVKYTNSNQGGLYVLNDDNENNHHLELISLFAFDAKKFDRRKVRLGEGVLGQTFLEKETTLLNEIPEEYIRITSGLGDANPKSILIVPLKVDKVVYGIVELASFRNYQSHEIEFVERLAETIASTLASVKVGHKNRNLIEQFQQQTEEMRAQEEEMRQNMEELQATQEELSRKEQDYISRIAELESMSGKATGEELERLRAQLEEKESQFHNKVRELERKLSEQPKHTQEWAVAQELEKTLRIQLEALKITREVLNR